MGEEQEAYNAWLALQDAEKFYRQAEAANEHAMSLEERLAQIEEERDRFEMALQVIVLNASRKSADWCRRAALRALEGG
jgi:hypothetical protein